MFENKTKAELLEIAEEMGIDVPKKATVSQIKVLIDAKKGETEPKSPDSGEEAPVSCSKTVKCDGYTGLNVRTAPDFGAPVAKVLANGAEIAVEAVENGWAKVDGGFCLAKYLV